MNILNKFKKKSKTKTMDYKDVLVKLSNLSITDESIQRLTELKEKYGFEIKDFGHCYERLVYIVIVKNNKVEAYSYNLPTRFNDALVAKYGSSLHAETDFSLFNPWEVLDILLNNLESDLKKGYYE